MKLVKIKSRIPIYFIKVPSINPLTPPVKSHFLTLSKLHHSCTTSLNTRPTSLVAIGPTIS